MAEKVVLEVGIETGSAVKTLGDLENEISNLVDETNELNKTNQLFKKELIELEQQFKKIPKTALSARKKIGEQIEGLKFAIKDNNIALRDFRIEKQQKQKMIKDLKDVHHEVDNNVETFAKFGASIGEVVAGFMLLGGASEESTEKLEHAIGTVMTLKGASEGITHAQEIYNKSIKGNNLLLKINSTATAMASAVQKLFTGSVNTTSLAFKGLKNAIIATGIGALVVAVGLLIANFDKLKEAINGVSKAQKDALDDQQKAVDLADERLNSISEQENILKLQGKSERQILNMKILATKEAIKQREIFLDLERKRLTAEIEAEKRNRRYLENFTRVIFIIPRTIIKGIDLIGEGLNLAFQKIQTLPFAKKILGEEPINIDFGLDEKVESLTEGVAGLLFNPEETSKKAKETLAEIEKGIKAVENQQAGLLLSLKEGDDKADDELKKRQDADKKRRSEMQKVQIKGNEETKLELVEQEKTFNQKMLELYGEDVLAYEASLEKKKQEQLDAQNATFDLAQSGVNALLQLNEAFTGETEAQQKKAFERRKKLEIAGALISSAQGVVNILSNKSAVPSPFDIPFKAAQIGVLLATTVAQIAKIKQQQFSGGGSVSSPNVGGGGIPTISPVTNTSTLVPQEPTQVFVTETDISNTQNKVNVIEAQATIK